MKDTAGSLILILILCAAPLAGLGDQGAANEAGAEITSFELAGIPEPWRGGFEQIESDLVAGRWQAAAGAAGRLADRMARLFPANPTGRVLVASALAMQAIAEAESGHQDRALWHWQIAQNVNPDLRLARMDTLGETGAWLEARRLRAPGTLDGGSRPAEVERVPPAPLSAPPPEPPAELRPAWKSERLEVEVIVDAEGRVRSPVVVGGGELPGKVYFALAALERWRFRPALAAGVPVDALLRLDGMEPRTLGFVVARSPALGPVHKLLLEERWQEARSAAQRLVGESLECVADRQGKTCALGMALVLRAVAEVGLERLDDALWSWHLAYSYHPLPAAGSLAIYGPGPGRLLASPPCAVEPEVCGAVALLDAPGLAAPRPIATPPLRLPPELAVRLDGDRFVASLWVDVAGRVRGAVMRAGHSEAAGYLALMAARDWRFEPARRGGEPVAVVYEASIPLVSAAPAAQVARWRREMDDLDQRLTAGGGVPRSAYDEVSTRVAEIAAATGSGGSDLLARGVAQLALAAAGLGLADEAVWHWHSAQNLAVDYRFSDLSAYGAAGELLGRHRLRQPGEGGGDAPDPDREAPPRRIAGPEPQYPRAPGVAGVGAPERPDVAILELIVDQDGLPRAPVVLAGRSPARLFAALEAVREWRFEPVVRDRIAAPALRRLTLPLGPRMPLKKLALAPDARALARLATREARKDPRLAGCYWQVARSLDPALASADPPLGSAAAAALLPADRWSLATPAAGPRLMEVAADVEPPRKIHAPQPLYTPAARRARLQGEFLAQGIIDVDGWITGIEVLEGLPGGLNVEVAKAICRWRFEPATRAGEPVPVHYRMMTRFSIGESVRGAAPRGGRI